MADATELTLTTDDRIDLFIREYRALAPTGRTLLIVHGASEHGGRYDHVAQGFTDAGWNVIVPDTRGHGRSGGPATHVRDFTRYVRDLELIRSHFQLQPSQTAMLAHSMGGLIALRDAQIHPGRSAALVTTSPLLALEVDVPVWTVAAGKALSYVAPRTRFRSRIDPRFTTRNEDVLRRRAEDPLMHRSITAQWFFAMKRALRDVWRQAGDLQIPLLLLQAGQDRIVSPHAAEPWIRTVGSPDATLRVFPEHLHEILNEPDWEQTLRDILRWLDPRIDPHARPASAAG